MGQRPERIWILDFLSDADLVNQETIEQEQFSVPVNMFLSGDTKLVKKMKGVEGTGGWFMPLDSTGDRDLSEADWTQDNFTTNDGNTVEGWFKSEIKAMLIIDKVPFTSMPQQRFLMTG